MTRESRTPITIIRIRLQVIEHRYGRDNFDNAGDDLANCLASVSDYPNQYRSSFEFDTSHPNRYFHTMNFVVQDMDEAAAGQLKSEIQTLGLLEC